MEENKREEDIVCVCVSVCGEREREILLYQRCQLM